MAINWDWLIGLAIIVGLILAIWAKISQQTIVELLKDIRDFAQGKGEDTVEYANEVTI